MNLKMLKTLLESGVVRVTFSKINGELRIMDCTKDLQRVPPSSWPKGEQDLSEKEEKAVKVYDVNAQGWRSFLTDNVIDVQLL